MPLLHPEMDLQGRGEPVSAAGHTENLRTAGPGKPYGERKRMSSLDHFIAWTDRISRAINIASMGVYFAIMFLTIAGIAARLLGVPLNGLINLSESLLVVAVYFALAYAQQAKQHVAVELVVSSLPKTPQKILGVINLIIPLCVCTILIIISWDFALESWGMRERMDGAPYYPIYPPKIAIAVGISLLWLQLLSDLFREIMASFTRLGRDHS